MNMSRSDFLKGVFITMENNNSKSAESDKKQQVKNDKKQDKTLKGIENAIVALGEFIKNGGSLLDD